MTKYYQKEIETMPVEKLKQLQSEKLVRQVRHVYENVPYYRALMDEKGLFTGGLASVLRLLDENDINLEYMYAMIPKTRPTALIVMRVDDNEKTEKLLADNGVKVIEGMDRAI